MTPRLSADERIAQMKFGSVYPLYVDKVVKKGRTEDELQQVLRWLTGYTPARLEKLIEKEVTIAEFFSKAKLNPDVNKITGVICGYRVEEIENPLTQQARYMDKLVDELAKGKAMEKILRS